MTTFTLIAANSSDGPDIAENGWGEATHQDIDPIDYVAVAKLISIVTGDSYEAVTKRSVELTPEQPDVDPWDVDALFAFVCAIADADRDALIAIPDNRLTPIATEWSSIEEFSRLPFTPEELVGTIQSIQELAVAARAAGLSVLLYMAP